MIEIKDVTYTYNEADQPALEKLSISISKGECVLLCGKSGCGKSTVTRLLNGMIPNFYEGKLSGQVLHDGQAVQDLPMHKIAERVGTVFQNPRTQFYTVNTTSEIVFGCENLGMPRRQITERLRQTAEDLQIEDLLDRSIFGLSGGEKQIVAFASVYAMQPEVYVLDEPSANLDMATVKRLRRSLGLLKQQGKTIVIAEHRLFYLRGIFDRAIYMEDGKIRAQYTQEDFDSMTQADLERTGLRFMSLTDVPTRPIALRDKRAVLSVAHLEGYHGKRRALCIENASFGAGRAYAVIGRNGAGKSTFAAALCATLKKASGKCLIDGNELGKRRRLKLSYLVMQEVNHQIFADSVATEVTLGSRDSATESGALNLASLLTEMDLAGLENRHPMTLSGGQKQRVIIASACFSGKKIIILDEPTSGLDYAHMMQTVRLLRRLREEAGFLFVITHDYEFIAEACDEVIRMDGGRIAEQYPLDEIGIAKLKDFFEIGES